MPIEYAVDAQRLSRDLSEFASAVAQSMRPTMTRIDDELRRSLAKNFAIYGRPEKWQPLRPGTVRARRRRGLGHNVGGDRAILRDTDRLRLSLVSPPGAGRDQISRIGDHEVVRGTSVPYAGFHQSDEPRHRLPRRAFLLLQEEDMRKIDALVEEEIDRRLARHQGDG